MTVEQYINRQYDYQALRPIDNQLREQRVSLELFSPGNSGFILTGVRKLAQRWLLEFLTVDGSMSKLPDRGSLFMRSAFSGKFRSGLNVRHEFKRAATQIARNLQREETEDMPDDEKLESAELVDYTVAPSTFVSETSGTTIVYLSLRIKINSTAGTNYETILPIPTTPKGLT